MSRLTGKLAEVGSCTPHQTLRSHFTASDVKLSSHRSLNNKIMASAHETQRAGGGVDDWTNAFIDLGSAVRVAYHPDVKLAVDPSIDVDTYDRDPTQVPPMHRSHDVSC